jgi:transposase-like protein
LEKYSFKTKENAVRKYLSGTSAEVVGRDVGVSSNTIRNWVKVLGADVPPLLRGAKGPTKTSLVIEYQGLDDSKRGEWLRKNGLQTGHIQQWTKELEKDSNENQKLRAENKKLKAELKKSQREIDKKDKALAESAALLVLKKSTNTFGGTRTNDDKNTARCLDTGY